MRTSTFLLAGPVAVSAQVLSTITGRVQTATISSGSEVLYTTTWTYSNPATNYLTLTDSEGVVTGMPSGSAGTLPAGEMPEAETSQPAVATIPAGLPTGVTYIPYNGTAGLTSFQVSVGSSTTQVIGASPTDASVTSAGGSSASGSSSSGGSGSGSGSNSNSDSDSSSSSSDSDASSSDSAASASASESGNAASSVRVAGAGVGLLAFIAALL